MYVYLYVNAGAYKGQRYGMSQDLELQAIVNCLTWMLGIDFRSLEDPPRGNLNVKDLAKVC